MKYQDVYDVKLKPRILEYLMNDQIPNENDPSPQQCDLQRVVNAINNLGLLSESLPEGTKNSKIAEDWAIAVDSWVHRVLSLVSSPRSRKCWTGICLLGVTCRECSSNRLLAWYPVWFDKLLANIQPASDYISVKVATFASLSDLLKRLGKYSEIKKDVTLQAGKLIQPVLDLLLDSEFSEVLMEGALAVLCTIIDSFSASFLPHYEKAEAIIVSKIIAGQCSSSMMKSYAYFLASLPKSRGDKDSWVVMMQDLLTSIDIHLNDVFQCMEQAPERAENPEARKSKQLLTCIIPTLMLCCSTMLINSYPVQVTVPVQQLLTNVKRVLMVNDSFSQASLKSMAIMQEGFVCTELPVLQSYALDLLSAIIKGTSSQLLPHAGYTIRLLKDCFHKCALPMLRTKLYFIIRTLLISMGIGAALQIAEELTSYAFIDLDAYWYLNRQQVSNQDFKSTIVEAPLLQPADKKRKYTATGSLQENEDMDYLGLQLSNKHLTSPISLKIAALKALQTLLTMGSVLRPDLRSSINDLLMNVAVNAYDGKWRNDEENEVMSTYTDFLLAALHAVLASLLSQPSVNQHYLVKGLELFRKGKQEAGTKIADFCGIALLATEMLMNPIKVSICDIPSTSHGSVNEEAQHEMLQDLYSVPNENQMTPKSFSSGMTNQNQDDTLFNYLLDSYNESEATEEQHSKIDSHKTVGDYQVDHMLKFPGKEDQQQEPFLVEIERNSNEIMHDKPFQGPLSVAEAKPFIGIEKGPEMEFSNVGLDTIGCDSLEIAATAVLEKAERSCSRQLRDH
ncbi:hypothetical protein ES332_D09G021300v1 [Gossypium tomentosum]|uniref:Pre-rRNA-processing protein RIX1 N-terminal domain-containing protein n=1 Tax=Gossypium tomentosum TaxID=34277 RepID=A0A5D2JEA7_GOSTO|nr:hypothetical protein ES332_D09G021300v1 [Gossypium tomentosum]